MATCKVCQSQDSTILFKKYGYDICKCVTCQFVYTDLKPKNDFYNKFYSENYYQNGSSKRGYDDYLNEETSIRRTFRQKIVQLTLPQKGTVLDIGCAYGYFLKEMPQSWNKYGLEVSSHAANYASRLVPEAKIANSFFSQKSFPKISFDLITLFDVAEHLDNPREVFSLAYDKLKKNGKLVLTTGDVKSLFCLLQGESWHLYNPPQHLCYFSKTSISLLLSSLGFRDIKISYPSSTYSLSYLIYKIRSIYGVPIPIPEFTKKIYLKFNLWDIMMVTAVK